MVRRGSNFIALVLDTRLLVAVNGKASQKKQLNATYIMSTLVEHCKDVLSKEAYKELKKRYKKTVEQQKREKLKKAQEKFKREKEKFEVKKRELALKEQNAKTYLEQTKVTKKKENKSQKKGELKAEKNDLLRKIHEAEYEEEKDTLRAQLKEIITEIDKL